MKIKDGGTHLAYKAEHAVDVETGAVVGVTVVTTHHIADRLPCDRRDVMREIS